jgi:hypothetical protein
MTAEPQVWRRDFASSKNRWASFGSYYAMFPLEFAFQVIRDYSKPGQFVLDPFAGRATSVYAAAVLGRPALGIEITAVGWLFGQAKLHPARQEEVLARLDYLKVTADDYADEIRKLPKFYSYCFASNVLSFLLAARDHLLWRTVPADTTLMAFITMYLHGKLPSALSNQMRGTKAMSPEYSIRWWKEKGMNTPPAVDWYQFLRQRIVWRYEKGRPPAGLGEMWMGDSTELLKQASAKMHSGQHPRCSLLFTSPPYWSVINYYKDQWLRNWLLGGAELPEASPRKHEKRFASQTEYRDLLATVFGDCAGMMAEDGIAYVRTDAREFTLHTSVDVLSRTFPGWSMVVKPAPAPGKTQTHLFGDDSKKPGEMDVILLSPTAAAEHANSHERFLVQLPHMASAAPCPEMALSVEAA